MAILGDNDLSSLLDDAAKVDRDRKRNFATQMRRSGADALGFGDDLLALFTTLPAAVIASERAEYERVVKRYGEEHPRSRQVAEALAAFEGVEAQAARGRARAARAIESIQASGTAFFGFVTAAGGDPRVGYRVRLSGSNVPSGKLEAVTGNDGYFRIALPAPGASTPGAARRGSQKRAAAAAPDGETDTAPVLATVEILDRKGSSVYQDPVPLQVDAGSAYREYQIDDSDRGQKQATRPATATRKSTQKAKVPGKRKRSR